MREILFRGKEKLTEVWRYGSLLKYPNAATIKQIYGDRVFHTATYEIIPETVGQFTGLNDKNGTKIFEGDILSAHLDDGYPENETMLEVVWHNNGWYGKNRKFFDDFDNGFEKYFEVIGNIHDNSELLNK